MRYESIRKMDVSNGPGVRVTIFVTGCTHNCEGCFNKELQDFKAGKAWTEETESEVLEYIKKPIITGINVLGGEPLQQVMDDSLSSLLRKVRKLDGKDVWLWTGDVFEDAVKDDRKLKILENVDVLIDGKFEMSKRNIKLKYRGSENQRVIDLQRTLREGTIIPMEFEEQK